MRFALAKLVLMACCSASGASYWVATNGNDAADGSVGAPWLTISKASSAAIAGDRVVIGPGVFQINATNWQSGVAGSPIIFEGNRAGDGSWSTIVDPSVPLTNNWTLDPDWGSYGVYRNTTASFPAAEMHIGNRRLASVYTTNAITSANQYLSAGLSNGVQFLILSNSAFLTMNLNSSQKVSFWEGIGAIWASSGTTNWLRLADGSDPNGLDIRLTRNAAAFSTGPVYAGWRMDGMSHLIISNIWIRNAFCGFLLKNCTNVTIISNRVTGGNSKISVSVGASTNTIAGNLCSTDFFGWADPGAWGNGNSNRAHLYFVAKYLMTSASETFDSGISLDSCGSGNTVAFNTVTNGIGQAIEVTCVLGAYPAFTNTVVASNRIANWSSVGVLSSTGARNVYIHDNLIQDCNLNFRAHKIDDSVDTFRPVWFYRNRCWLPSNVSEHVYFHANSATKHTYEAEYNLYHNVFNGGRGGVTASSYLYSKSGMTNIAFVNNVFSGCLYWYADDSAWRTSRTTFDYNVITLPFPSYPSTNVPIWWGSSNRVATTNLWALGKDTEPTSYGIFDFGFDIGTAFTLGDVTRTPLPDSLDTYFGARDVGAYELTPWRNPRYRSIRLR